MDGACTQGCDPGYTGNYCQSGKITRVKRKKLHTKIDFRRLPLSRIIYISLLLSIKLTIYIYIYIYIYSEKSMYVYIHITILFLSLNLFFLFHFSLSVFLFICPLMNLSNYSYFSLSFCHYFSHILSALKFVFIVCLSILRLFFNVSFYPLFLFTSSIFLIPISSLFLSPAPYRSHSLSFFSFFTSSLSRFSSTFFCLFLCFFLLPTFFQPYLSTYNDITSQKAY